MVRNAKKAAVLAAAIVGGTAAMAGAQVIGGNLIYSDSFSNTTGNAIALNGHMPDVVNAYGSSWVSTTTAEAVGTTPDAIFMIPAGGGSASVVDGAANPLTTEDSNTVVDAYLPVSIQAGSEYDLTVRMQVPTVATGGHGTEMAFMSANDGRNDGPTITSNGSFGSEQYPDVADTDGDGALNNLNCYGLILQKDTGVVQMFAGENTGNQNAGTLNDTSTIYNTFDIVLNTQPTQWTISQYLNGVMENSTTLASNPNLPFIGLAVNRTSGNFDFSFTQLPEPGVMTLVGVGALALTKRRRTVKA